MKCGTTTLAAQLAAQDGVFITTPKEPNFFSDDAIYGQGMGWYEALFDAAAPGEITGEASTHYTKLPAYPETVARMHAQRPDLRLVYMIRNPVDRAVSHYIHGWTEGRMGADAAAAFAAHPEIVDYGSYGRQITPFIEAYGPGRVMLTSLEQITADPSRAFGEIAAFLGLPEEAAWDDGLGAQNVSAQRMKPLPFHGLIVDHPLARRLRHALVPKGLRRWIGARRTKASRPEVPPAIRRSMEGVFARDRAVLAGHFPNHPALELCYPFAPPQRTAAAPSEWEMSHG